MPSARSEPPKCWVMMSMYLVRPRPSFVFPPTVVRSNSSLSRWFSRWDLCHLCHSANTFISGKIWHRDHFKWKIPPKNASFNPVFPAFPVAWRNSTPYLGERSHFPRGNLRGRGNYTRNLNYEKPPFVGLISLAVFSGERRSPRRCQILA